MFLCIFSQCLVFLQCSEMIYSDLNCWGSGSWTYEITLWRLLLQLYFVAVFALVGVQAGWWDNTEESGHNGAALRKNGNCFQIMTQRHPDMIPESVETHLRYRKESNNSLSEYLQRFTLMFCLSLWLLTFPSLQILRPNFILEKNRNQWQHLQLQDIWVQKARTERSKVWELQETRRFG